MKRRDMLWGVVAGAAAKAQTAANAGPQDDLAAAKERVKNNGTELAKFAVARDMEPGFVFEA
jgi:hypothetical protein